MCSMRVHAGGRALAHMPHAQGPGAARQRGARRCLLAPKRRVSVPPQLPYFRPRNCQRFLRLTQDAPCAARYGGGPQRPPRTVEVPLVCTLQELAKGTTKKRKITRHVLRDGKPQPKEVPPTATFFFGGVICHDSSHRHHIARPLSA